MILRPPRYTRTYPLFPYPTPFRSKRAAIRGNAALGALGSHHRWDDRRQPVLARARMRGTGSGPRLLLANVESRTALCRDLWRAAARMARSEEHTSELQSLMRLSYAVFCLTKQITTYIHTHKT